MCSTGAGIISAGSTGASSTGAGSTSASKTGAANTSAGSSSAGSTSASRNGAVSSSKNVGEINIVNKNGIYAVLLQIGKCRKTRVFGANFFGLKNWSVLILHVFATMMVWGTYLEKFK